MFLNVEYYSDQISIIFADLNCRFLTTDNHQTLPLQEGSILIDGLDIHTISLQNLRSNIGVIPQDSIVFSGSLRFNLDPLNNKSDPELIGFLKEYDMLEYFKNQIEDLGPDKIEVEQTNEYQKILDIPILENGTNLSSGQKQLLCILRALIPRPKILLMDEATSNIDQKTDVKIQKIIRDKCQHCTISTLITLYMFDMNM